MWYKDNNKILHISVKHRDEKRGNSTKTIFYLTKNNSRGIRRTDLKITFFT